MCMWIEKRGKEEVCLGVIESSLVCRVVRMEGWKGQERRGKGEGTYHTLGS